MNLYDGGGNKSITRSIIICCLYFLALLVERLYCKNRSVYVICFLLYQIFKTCYVAFGVYIKH